MNKELRIFMDSSDEEIFMIFIDELVTEIQKESDFEWLFIFGNSFIQFLRSYTQGSVSVIGRIAISTTQSDNNAKAAESVFRKIEKWIKANYSNKVQGRNINIKDSQTPVKNIWVGKSIAKKVSNRSIELRQSYDGYIVYKIF